MALNGTKVEDGALLYHSPRRHTQHQDRHLLRPCHHTMVEDEWVEGNTIFICNKLMMLVRILRVPLLYL